MRKLHIISATALAMSLAMPAYAQNAPETEEEASDEIIVTATLRAMDVQDIPLAVTAVAPEALER
jgi:iron complex outermembrane receptor protein